MEPPTGQQESLSGTPQPTTPPPVQSLYCNGFEIGAGNADIYLVIHQNGHRVLMLNFSYTTAKTLGDGLTNAIAMLEEKTGRKIMTSKEILELISLKESKKKKEPKRKLAAK